LEARLGLITYTNLTSGIGVFGWEFWQYLGTDSILSVGNAVKGQEDWTERQLTVRQLTAAGVDEYFSTYHPDVVMFLETPFCTDLFRLARERGIATVGIPMHESHACHGLRDADLLCCPCREAWEKIPHPNKRLVFLPIGLKMFPYKKRTGHTFVANLGYGGVRDRRQVAKTAAAFRQLEDPGARLIINSRAELPRGMVDDPRIKLNVRNYAHPRDIYQQGDISILPIAYGGYERSILESMASGMPTLTMDASPMNLFQHDSDFLIEPCSRKVFSEKWVVDTVYNEVSVEDLAEKLEWLLTIDTAEYSRRARRQAVAQSWESKDIDYKSVWMKALEDA
jgi:glycosyltransferase involved in cell wall biosynthesis